ncbi:hypothetical protein OAG1_31800 [Agarivorans sp. OAG1]|uniref:hypothetical protein n=1 Tax=Agarivorans sp. OAG1 TaxID=3082387 RepID=UPI002B2D8107|nr:hypothetical protein OAG1_31800 [Agarivorans sp. OAG1]
MKYLQNYETFHLHELEGALKKLDVESNPDEAAYIKELIDKGGYQYPSSVKKSRLAACTIKHRAFKYFLVVFFSYGLLVRISMQMIEFNAVKLIGDCLTFAIIVSAITEYKYLKHMLMVSCLAGLVAWLGIAIQWYYSPDFAQTQEYPAYVVISFLLYLLAFYGTLKWVKIERVKLSFSR